MEETLEKLKQIGIKEINKTTKISTSKIEDILNKNFSSLHKLQRMKVNGFVHILEREYKIDLSQWLKEYDQWTEEYNKKLFVDENKDQKPPMHEGCNNLDLDPNAFKEHVADEKKQQCVSKKKFYISFIVAIAILGGYFVYKKVYNQTYQTSINDESPTQQPSQISSQTSNNDQPTITKSDATPVKEDNLSSDQKEEETPKSETTDIKTNSDEQITITPDRALWFEVINLDTKHKTQKTINTTYSIDIKNSRLLISFGHGEFSLATNQGVKHFQSPKPVRFLYTPDNGLNKIQYNEYLKLLSEQNQ